MSTPAHFDSEIFPQTNRAQSSRVPIPLSDNPYRVVRQSHLADTNIKQAYTPATIDTESDPEEAPSKTEEFVASEPSKTRIASSRSSALLDSTAPLSLDHPLT
ncbi:hypothetical protein Tco_1170040 [Tanacetum coccineum]